MFIALLAGLMMVASSPGAAATPAPAGATPAPSSSVTGKSDPNRMICKKESIPGSRFTTKTCRTLAEWEQLAEDARTVTRDIQSGPNLPSCGSGQC